MKIKNLYGYSTVAQHSVDSGRRGEERKLPGPMIAGLSVFIAEFSIYAETPLSPNPGLGGPQSYRFVPAAFPDGSIWDRIQIRDGLRQKEDSQSAGIHRSSDRKSMMFRYRIPSLLSGRSLSNVRTVLIPASPRSLRGRSFRSIVESSARVLAT